MLGGVGIHGFVDAQRAQQHALILALVGLLARKDAAANLLGDQRVVFGELLELGVAEVLDPFRGDRLDDHEPVIENGRVILPSEIEATLAVFRGAGFTAMSAAPEDGGFGLPRMIANAAPWSYALKEQYLADFPEDSLWEIYGSTELGVDTVLPPEDQLRKPGSCGKTYGGIEVKAVDENGNTLPPNEPGELFFRTALAMEGYHATEEQLAEAILARGDYWGYNRHCVEAKSDARDAGQVFRYLRGPMQGRILDLVDAFGHRSPGEIRLELPLPQRDLAQLAGISRETACRTLRRLKKTGVLDYRGRDLRILRPDLLERLASMTLVVTMNGLTVLEDDWTYFVMHLASPVAQSAIGLYLLLGGAWLVNKCIPSNRPYCPECGYDLSSSKGSGRCPECGVPIPSDITSSDNR